MKAQTLTYRGVEKMLKGGCYCGQIRYEAKAPYFNETNCHCSICRRTSGAPFVTWFSVKRTHFNFVIGEPTRFRSTENGQRTFCSKCGTQLTFEHKNFPDEIDITVCSLDEPNTLPPKDHTRARSMLKWVELADSLPMYADGRQIDA